MMNSLYYGTIEHRRHWPVKNEFTYRVGYVFLNMDEVEQHFNLPLLLTHNTPGLLSFWDKDYLKVDFIRQFVREQSGFEAHKIYIFTNPSYLGFCFNPVSFYYCYDQKNSLIGVCSQITNTPWGEKHLQFFKMPDQGAGVFYFPKDFHVSPFMPMEIDYRWQFSPAEEDLRVIMQNRDRGEREVKFDSTLRVRRRPLSRASLLGLFFSYPLMTIKTMTAIYYQAAKLYLKKVPFHTHPSKLEAP